MHLSYLTTILSLTTFTLGDCSLKTKTATLSGKKETLKGPFALKASASGSPLNGNRASGVIGGKIIWDVQPEDSSKATSFYLNGNGHLLLVQASKAYTAYEKDASMKSGNVLLGTSDSTNMKCSVDKSDCRLKCSVAGGEYDCLASPEDKPDWRIAKSKSNAAGNCVKFTPIVVPQ